MIEGPKQNRPKLEKSPWEKEVQNALYFCETEERAAKKELGEFRDGGEGTLEEEYRRKAEMLLYEFMRTVGEDKLPEKVLLEKTTSSPGITLNAGSLGSIGIGGSDAITRYFLPKQNIVYRINNEYYANSKKIRYESKFKREEDEYEFDPEKPNFIGFDRIRDLKGDSEFYKVPSGIHCDTVEENSRYKQYRLTSEEISIIVSTFQQHFTGTDLEGSSGNLIAQVDKILNEEFTKKVKEVQIEHAERIKNRILQLLRVMIRGVKLPKYLQGTPVGMFKPGEPSSYKTLLIPEEKLIIVPFRKKKTILRGVIEEPDMTKERPSDITDWLQSGLLFELRQYIPQKIKDATNEALYQ